MREEWYVVPARYALRLREVVDPPDSHDDGIDNKDDVDESDAVNLGPDDDALIEGLYAADFAADSEPHEPPPPRHLPRKSSGHLKR